jgi:hypothetical protein
MWGRAAAVTASPAADASMMPTTPGKTACASPATKIQPRTNRETRLPTLAFPLVEITEQSNRPRAPDPNVAWLANTQVCCCILTREYAGQSIIADHLVKHLDYCSSSIIPDRAVKHLDPCK